MNLFVTATDRNLSVPEGGLYFDLFPTSASLWRMMEVAIVGFHTQVFQQYAADPQLIERRNRESPVDKA